MTTIATGIAKKLTYKKETTWGVAATGGAAQGQALRRVTSNLALKKATYQSKEIRADFQVADFRHGVRSVSGTISGELSPGTYADFIASICRNTWQAKLAPAAYASNAFTAAPIGGTPGTGTITRTAGSFLTDGWKTGDVVVMTGWGDVTMDGRNFWITSLTDLVMTGKFLDGGTFTDNSAEAGAVSIQHAGKKTWMATSNHVNDSYSVEHWFSDVAQSELFTGNRVNDISIKLPASGMATIDVGLMGKDVITGTAAYFSSPAAATTTGVLAAVNGVLAVNGLQVGLLTSLEMKLSGGMSSGEVVGSNTTPDIFMGAMTVSGQFVAYFTDNTLANLFLNETETLLACVFTTSNAATADFMAFTLGRIKLGSADKDDGEKGITITASFTALLNTHGGAGTNAVFSTMTIQDSQAV